MLPYMAENYNISDKPERRAFAGYSMGGATVGYALFHNTDDFKYYGLLSAPMTPDVAPDYTLPALMDKKIFMSSGLYDYVSTRSLYSVFPDADGNLVLLTDYSNNGDEGSTYEYVIEFSKAGVPFTTLQLPVGHTFDLWRPAIINMFDNVLWK
jgi:S-formylglutathione hydrolase FrmB